MLWLVIVAMVSFTMALFFFFQAEDGIRDLVRSRGLGDVYKRQVLGLIEHVDVGVLAFLNLFVDVFRKTFEKIRYILSLIHI